MNRPTGGPESFKTATPPPGRGAGRLVLVANPTAGGFRRRTLDAVASRLAAAGRPVDVRLTDHAGHLVDIATHLEADTAALVVGGGDGSLNEAVTGLIRRDLPPPALGVMPFGTANVLAHELSLPFRAGAIAEAILAGRTKPLHLGVIGDRPFLLMVSAGFDGDVVHAIDIVAKRRWGKLAYAAAAIRLALAQKGRDVVVEADGERIVSRLAVVTTAGFYGGPLTITRGTRVTRPGLRLVSLSNDRPGTLARAAIALALGRLDRMAEITDRTVREVRLSGEGIAMQIDGDSMETTDGRIRAEGRTLDVIVR